MSSVSTLPKTTHVIEKVVDMRRLRAQWQTESGTKLALVPTMGALHEGHLSLIRLAKIQAKRVVVSIFVNPLQFGPDEDFARYPRSLEQDLQHCRKLGVDAVFVPSVEELYPTGMDSRTLLLPPAQLSERLCGLSRPGHFTGVATVVLKLFNVVQPNLAVFGEKDAQQLAIIRQMVRDLDVPVEILAHPIVREGNGVALSSRNRYLETEAERQASRLLSRILNQVKTSFQAQGREDLPARETLSAAFHAVINDQTPEVQALFKVEYLEAVDKNTFQPVNVLNKRSKLLIAAHVGSVRLIDNIDLA